MGLIRVARYMSEPNMRPLLTFAVCAYKQEQFIREAAEAALAQTYSPLEVILSDDCSPDRTFEIMEELAAAYRGPHRIVLNRNPVNVGLGKHVNRVLEMVQGEYLVVAAGDDVSLPERTEVMYQAWERSGRKSRMIQCGTIDIDDQGALLNPQAVPATKLEITEQRPPLLDYVRTLTPGVFGCALAYDPKLFSIFGPLPEGLIHEDNMIALRTLMFGPMLFVNLPLLKRRIHGNNIFSRFHERVATREAVAKQEDRTTRDARNRAVLYDAILADLLEARKQGLITESEWHSLEREAIRRRRLFTYQMEHMSATMARKFQILFAAWRDQADSRLIKWMLPRLLPRRLFQSLKAGANSVRKSVEGKLRPESRKHWT
jgi:glycosyltransferase involved in cell wall biosynthesis